MRNEFVSSFLKVAREDKRVLLLSGDLGFNAFEPVQKELGDRFLNCGIAEQNMASVAAGLAARGFRPWLYSIAPFATLRPYEQIRNDICLHSLPVCIVGNGGGYGYGIMGSTHHALEDVGCMQLLPNMQVHVPALLSDVEKAIHQISKSKSPSYLRLGMAYKSDAQEISDGWQRIREGSRGVVITSGPILKAALEAVDTFDKGVWEVISVSKFPLTKLPDEVKASIKKSGRVVTVEEHLRHGGLGEKVASLILESSLNVGSWASIYAQGYPSGKYGSQKWHWEDSQMSGPAIKQRLENLLNRQ